jgi:hypothetical protein
MARVPPQAYTASVAMTNRTSRLKTVPSSPPSCTIEPVSSRQYSWWSLIWSGCRDNAV